MIDIYEKTLKLMKEHLDSMSNEEFLSKHESLGKSSAPLIEDFLAEPFFSVEDNLIVCNDSIDLELLFEGRITTHLSMKKIEKTYDDSYTINDSSYKLELAA